MRNSRQCIAAAGGSNDFVLLAGRSCPNLNQEDSVQVSQHPTTEAEKKP
jgi:hypothetical protein